MFFWSHEQNISPFHESRLSRAFINIFDKRFIMFVQCLRNLKLPNDIEIKICEEYMESYVDINTLQKYKRDCTLENMMGDI